MNKKIAIGVGAIIVIALLVGFFMRSKNTAEVKDEMMKSSLEKAVTQPQGMQNTLKGLLGMGQSQTCTYSVGEGLGTGTVYISGGKMSMETMVGTGSSSITSHMVMDGKTSYSWMDGQKTGYKMDFEAMQANTVKGDVNNSGQANIDVDKQFSFQCSNWTPDSSKFALPAGVEFTDMAKMMQDMQKMQPSGQTQTMPTQGQSMEAICAGLQEPAKGQCLAAIKGKQ